MKRTIATVALGLGLIASGAASAQAQQAPPGVTSINTTGNCVTTGTPGNYTISCGDINYSPGNAVMVAPTINTSNAAGSDGVTHRSSNSGSLNASPAPAPVAAPVEEVTSDSVTGTVATADDRDADNYPDALEAEAGLDPTNPDTDGDGVADGDEFTLYSTYPLSWDTDGDGISDGEELFGIKTDPLVNNNGAASAPVAETTTPTSPEPVGETLSTAPVDTVDAATSDAVTATDSDSDGVADVDEVNIYRTDPYNADSDGDGLT
ncbi:MAG: hypothetical protein KC442_01640, partial [Thermomicrobiales bacterium]|nr:hypothetical protein [Thermomicrobiales bacterium]